MSSRSSETVPFWAAASLVRESNGPQGRVISMDGMESWTGKLTGAESDSTASGTPFQRGDVLFGKLRPYLAKSWLADESGTAQGDIHVYRPHASTHPKYLAYIIRSREFVHFANAASEGVKMPRVEWTKLRSYDIPLPDLPTQRRIADYLDRETAQIDAMAETLDGLVARLKERRSETVRDAFISATKMSKLAKIQYVATVLVGIVITPAKYYVERGNGIPAVRGLNLTPTGIDADNLIEISPEGHQVNSRSTLRAGDIATVRTGKVGLSAVVQDELSGANAIDIVISKPHNSIHPDYLCSFLNSPIAREYMNLEKVGSVQSHLNVDAMKKLPIPLPPLEEQRRIADHLDAETVKINAMIAKAGELRALLDERRSALITATVTGQHPVPEEH